MSIYYHTSNPHGNDHTKASRHSRPNDTHPSNRHPPHTSAGTNSIHTLHTGKKTSTHEARRQHRNPSKTPPVTVTTYSPVFSVHYHRRYNPHTGRYEVSHVTRTVNSEFAYRAREQVAASIASAKKTRSVVQSFSRHVDTRDWDIKVQAPTETRVSVKSKKHKHNQQTVPALTEPYLPDTHTIMCNSGWITEYRDGTAHKLLLALPHYSYVWSGRQFIIGSLQASIDYERKAITIKAPTLMSREGNVYGYEDIGMKGIRNYFYWNPRSRYVPDFVKPRHTEYSHDASPQNLVASHY